MAAVVKHARSCQTLSVLVLALVQLSRCDLSSKIPQWSQDLCDADVPSAAEWDWYINVPHMEALGELFSSSTEHTVWMLCSVKQTFLGGKKRLFCKQIGWNLWHSWKKLSVVFIPAVLYAFVGSILLTFWSKLLEGGRWGSVFRALLEACCYIYSQWSFCMFLESNVL